MRFDMDRLPTGAAGWNALVDHAVALGDLSEVGWLELKGALSFETKTDRKRSAAVMARAVLGMANRMPEAASRYAGGHGVVLLGVQGQSVVGAARVDPAVLTEIMRPYLGADGPRWDHVFVNHPDGLVLAIIVDPPQWGDPIHTNRKEFQDLTTRLSVRDGDIFVRYPGQTRPASSHDLAELQRRRERSPSAGARIDVQYDDKFDHVDLDSVRELACGDVHARADALLAGLPEGPVEPDRYRTFGGPLAGDQDRRSASAFRAEVEQWRSASLRQAETVVAEFLRHHLSRGRFALQNTSSRYFQAVQVQVQFPPGVLVLVASDTAYCDHGGPFRFLSLLPEPPAEWGSSTFQRLIRPPPTQSNVHSIRSNVDVVDGADGALLTWDVGDLRPRSTERGQELLALVTGKHINAITAPWRVTARKVDHVFEDTLTVSCAQEPGTHLSWSDREHLQP